MLRLKLRGIEQKLNDSEHLSNSLQIKFQKLQKDFKQISKERDDFRDLKEEKETEAEKYRTMKIKSLEVLKTLFSEESPKLLSLRYMELENSFIEIIAAIIKKYPSIEVIDLEGNFITDAGTKLLAEIILFNEGNLNELNLSYNKISAEGAWILVQAIKARDETRFKRIKRVVMTHNLIEKSADIFLKAWEYFKPIRDLFPNNLLKISDLRRASSNTATRMFTSAVGNIKEVQDLLGIIERIVIEEKRGINGNRG